MSSGPRITLKLATSLDGRIATASGESQWITGEAARAQAHRLRAAHDAVLAGSQTVVDDDPLLTVRLSDFTGAQPLRVVADGRLRTTPAHRLVQSATPEAPVLVVAHERHAARGGVRGLTPPAAALAEAGARLGFCPGAEGAEVGGVHPDCLVGRVAQTLASLGRKPLGAGFSVLLEGGGALAAAFMAAGLVSRVEWFRAPIVLGAEGRPALGRLGLTALTDAPRFRRCGMEMLGEDLWERYEAAPAVLNAGQSDEALAVEAGEGEP